jgi:PAS domain S-box-containing protein
MEKARILLVEDEVIIAMELENKLKKIGYAVTSVVSSGEAALEKAGVDRPDLILMDIRIKGEMDGIETAEAIRKKFGIPIVFSTAYLDEGKIERAKITMPFGYLLKPIQDRDLRVTLEMALYVAEVDNERRTAERSLEQFFNLVPDPVCIASTDGYFKQLNPAWEKLLGFTNEELLSRPLEEFIHPDDRQETKAEMEKQINGQSTISFINRYRCKDGSYKTFDWHAAPSQGCLLFASARDITDQKNLEHQLSFVNAAVEKSPTGFGIVGTDGKILYVNQAYAEMWGYDAVDEVIGTPPEEHFLDPNIPSQINKQLTERGQSRFEFKAKRKDGSLFDVLIFAHLVKDHKGQEIFIGTSIDITEQKRGRKISAR